MPLFVMRHWNGERHFAIEYRSRPLPKLREGEKAIEITEDAAKLGIRQLIKLAGAEEKA